MFYYTILTNHEHYALRAHPQAKSNDAPTAKVDMAHFEPLGSWSSAKLDASRRDNPFMMTWVPGKARDNVPNMTHGEGVYLYDDRGKQYMDWTSQAVCANLGHDVPEAVVQAAAYQMSRLPFTYGGIGVTEVRYVGVHGVVVIVFLFLLYSASRTTLVIIIT